MSASVGNIVETEALASICAAAVDPLEIAAALEAAGVSQHVVNETTAHSDVFSLASTLWERTPFAPHDVTPPPCWRRGNASDLGRGALYAAPGLLIHAVTAGAGLHLEWWALPLAMTWGWGLGQVTAFCGYTMRARQDPAAESRIVSLVLVAAIVTTAGLAWIATTVAGGGLGSAIGATCVTAYMVSSAVLLLHEEERLGATLLAPGAAVGLAVLVGGDAVPDWLVIGAIAGSMVATALAALRHLSWPTVPAAALTTTDVRRAGAHLVHGILCGLALSVVVLVGVERVGLPAHAALVTLPLLATLGVMEWRLRTFRADVETLSRTLQTVDGFAWTAFCIFVRGFGVYVASVCVVATAVAVALRVDGTDIPIALLTAEIALGAAFYIDLTVTSLGRLEVVLRSWLAGVGCAAAAMCVAVIVQTELGAPAWWSAHAAIWIVLLILIANAPRVVAAPCSH